MKPEDGRTAPAPGSGKPGRYADGLEHHGSDIHFRAIFEQAAVGIARANLDGTLALFNDKYSQITGYSAEELRRLRYHDITHPDDLAPQAELMGRLLAGEMRSFDLEKRYLRKDGRPIWVYLAVSLLSDGLGEPLGTLAVVRDVNARIEAQQRLRESDARLKLALDHSPVVVSSQDAGSATPGSTTPPSA
jgi:PAS domain S-box-containing protein